MTTPNKTEKNLMILLALTLFIVGTAIGFFKWQETNIKTYQSTVAGIYAQHTAKALPLTKTSALPKLSESLANFIKVCTQDSSNQDVLQAMHHEVSPQAFTKKKEEGCTRNIVSQAAQVRGERNALVFDLELRRLGYPVEISVPEIEKAFKEATANKPKSGPLKKS